MTLISKTHPIVRILLLSSLQLYSPHLYKAISAHTTWIHTTVVAVGVDLMVLNRVSPLTWLFTMRRMDSLAYKGPDQLVLSAGRGRMSSAWSAVIRRLDITTTHLLVKAAKVRAKSSRTDSAAHFWCAHTGRTPTHVENTSENLSNHGFSAFGLRSSVSHEKQNQAEASLKGSICIKGRRIKC